MEYKIIRKIYINENVSLEQLETQIFESFRQPLEKDSFRTFMENNSLFFERKIECKTRSKGAILEELFASLVRGKIEVKEDGKLTITLNYSKQLIVSLIIGLLIAFLTGLFSDYNSVYMTEGFLITSIFLFFAGYMKVYGLLMQTINEYKQTFTNNGYKK